MQTAELQPEIVFLQKQLDSLWYKFDEAVKNNAEMLLSVQHDDRYDELGTMFDKYTFSPYYGGLGNNCPTQNLVDD